LLGGSTGSPTYDAICRASARASEDLVQRLVEAHDKGIRDEAETAGYQRAVREIAEWCDTGNDLLGPNSTSAFFARRIRARFGGEG
jgi:hypothetical protein